MTVEFPLKFSSSGYNELLKKIFTHIHPVDYLTWSNRRYITLTEFAYLAAGFEPYHNGSLNSLLIELKEAIHNIASNEVRKNFYYLDEIVQSQFTNFNRTYNSSNGVDLIDKIISNAKNLLNYAEIINRESLLFNENDYELHSKKNHEGELMWRTGYLVDWAINIARFEIPDEILPFDRDYSIDNEILKKQLTTMDEKRLVHEGWFNTKACRAPKLLALIDGYIQEEELVAANPNRNFSTGNIASYIQRKYEVIRPSQNIEHAIKKLSEVASIKPSGFSFKKKVTQ
ncbi:hypothetical protein Lrub_0725 [Legionella rubrilucens]|uniref:Uncharacterized protein n=1 Tax=Legionella rubrilucens TaxID=458 RepID=A0A0W0XVB1_9GAMM|nr:hypothetical protein [Legionella rubrilucens]KTD48374.1 hypothetical protein Lrub_0725 [Legionella rubrilucens]